MRCLSLTLALLFTAGWNPTMAETVLSYDQIFGKEGDGYHARSALGFASLPTGPAVEVEAVFEISGE